MNAVLFKQCTIPQLISHPRIFFPLVEQHAKAEGKHWKLRCQMGRSPVIYDNLDGFVLLFTPSGKMLQTCLRFRQIFFQQKWKSKRN